MINRLVNNKNIGIIHFIGIGGIGISGISEVMLSLGFKVQGSDISESANTLRLAKKNIKIFIGHRKENIENASVVVRSSAVKDNNIEVKQARELGIPVIRRSEMLAELTKLKPTISIAGTHGKTTTTSLAASILEHAKMEPTVINGGIISKHNSNIMLGDGDWLLVEADESDGTFIKILSNIGVITNIDPEHLDFWGNFDAVKAAFHQFIQNLPFYGVGILCIDNIYVRELSNNISDRRIITYSSKSDEADIYASNIRYDNNQQKFDVNFADETWENVCLPIPGMHNISNSLASIAIAKELDIKKSDIIESLCSFQGVKRRFTIIGDIGQNSTIIDDYAHHPKEIEVTLKAGRDWSNQNGKEKLVAIIQPHRFSRLKETINDMAKILADLADEVLVLPVFSAGEPEIKDINSETLVSKINLLAKNKAKTLNIPSETKKEEASKILAETLSQTKNKTIIAMGAGNISLWVNELVS